MSVTRDNITNYKYCVCMVYIYIYISSYDYIFIGHLSLRLICVAYSTVTVWSVSRAVATIVTSIRPRDTFILLADTLGRTVRVASAILLGGNRACQKYCAKRDDDNNLHDDLYGYE